MCHRWIAFLFPLVLVGPAQAEMAVHFSDGAAFKVEPET